MRGVKQGDGRRWDAAAHDLNDPIAHRFACQINHLRQRASCGVERFVVESACIISRRLGCVDDRLCRGIDLVSSHGAIDSAGTSGWFEDELLDIQRKLPAEVYLRACIGCGLSDYSPYGHGLFGNLACFRATKAAYRSVTNKHGLFAIWSSATGYVQETYLCPEFERRRPGTGYRG